MGLLATGDTESVNRLYLRLERYMKILCGPLFLNFEDSENIFENLNILEDSVVETRSEDSRLLSRFKSKAIEKGLDEAERSVEDVMISSVHDSFKTENA